jgi:hypothetical protein
MAENTNITDALKKLDVANDDQWTASKQPTVAAVSELVGESVTREQIDAAADGFNRDTATGFFMSAGAPPATDPPADPPAKPWETSGQEKADGTVADAGVSQDAEGKTNEAGDSQKADGTVVDADPVDPAQINPEQAQAIDEPDQHPGQDANGDITGIRKNPDEVTAGEDGDNIDAENKPSGVPTGTTFRETEDSPGPPFNPADPVQAPTGDGGTGPESAAELTTSPRADGASEDDTASESGAGGPPNDNGASEQPPLVDADDSADEIAALEEELGEIEEDLHDLRVRKDKLTNHINKGEGRADHIRNRIEQLRPKNSDAGTIRAYLESLRSVAKAALLCAKLASP